MTTRSSDGRRGRAKRDGTRGHAKGYARRGRALPWIPTAVAIAMVVGGYAVLNSFDVFNAVGERVGVEGRGHVNDGQAIRYVASPPASGLHWPAPAPWGYSASTVPDERTVHSLEHGGIVVAINDVPDEDLTALRTFVDRYPDHQRGSARILIHQDERAPSGGLLLTAWDWRDRLATYDEARLREFVQAHIGRCCEDVR